MRTSRIDKHCENLFHEANGGKPKGGVPAGLRVKGNRVMDMNGTWTQEIPPCGGELNKTDIVMCDHEGDAVSGFIRRILPESQRARKWRFAGRQRGSCVFGVYWPHEEDASGVALEHGTFHLSLRDDTVLEGALVSASAVDRESGPEGQSNLQTVTVKWIRNDT